MLWLIQRSSCTRVSKMLKNSVDHAVLNESNQLYAWIQPKLLFLSDDTVRITSHAASRCLLLSCLLTGMAYIMQLAGCCGEEYKADFLLDACLSTASAHWLSTCRATASLLGALNVCPASKSSV